VWQQVGMAPNAPVQVAETHGGNLYISGLFWNLGPGLARWDGAAWSAVYGQPAGSLAPLHSHGNQLIGQGAGLFMRLGPAAPTCYANCDCSQATPLLTAQDFACFLQRFAAADPYANCDQSTVHPVLNVGDIACFLRQFAAGCP
jgi:hypothetical protein